ncbi:MAG: Helix-turn-helix domain [Solirubrobacteraceae bacterium]
MSDLARALLDDLDAEDLAALAERLVPFLPTPEGEEPGAWLTLREGAEYLRIGYQTAKRKVADGSIPCEREGGRVYLRRADLDEWRRR